MRTPLTPEEHERLRELLADGDGDRCPVDERLITLGLVRPYPGIERRVDPCRERLCTGGFEPYYEADGNVNPVSYPTIGEEDVLARGSSSLWRRAAASRSSVCRGGSRRNDRDGNR